MRLTRSEEAIVEEVLIHYLLSRKKAHQVREEIEKRWASMGPPQRIYDLAHHIAAAAERGDAFVS